MKKSISLVSAGLLLALPSLALAEDAPVSEVAYILNTFSFLMTGALVMWMAAGFAMLEAGLVRSKNTVEILTKNIALYAVASIMYMVVGYNIMYGDGVECVAVRGQIDYDSQSGDRLCPLGSQRVAGGYRYAASIVAPSFLDLEFRGPGHCSDGWRELAGLCARYGDLQPEDFTDRVQYD
jgi:hypothetical protein